MHSRLRVWKGRFIGLLVCLLFCFLLCHTSSLFLLITCRDSCARSPLPMVDTKTRLLQIFTCAVFSKDILSSRSSRAQMLDTTGQNKPRRRFATQFLPRCRFAMFHNTDTHIHARTHSRTTHIHMHVMTPGTSRQVGRITDSICLRKRL